MDINNLTEQETRHILKKIEELSSSDGWDILKSIMASETETFFRKIAAPQQNTSVDQYHYNRGIIESYYRTRELPDKLKAELSNRLLFIEKTRQQPATAG